MNQIPKDPVILFSYVNTQLRDHYSSLEELCAALDLSKDDLEDKLKGAGFIYDSQKNQFR